MNKKGELTSKQIVLIIILIVSFAAILIFFFSLNLKSEINTETCRNSVVLRGLPGGDAVSLNCKTQDVCFSIDGEGCGISGEVLNVKVSDSEQLADELTDFAYQCWWQMGSGSVDYVPSGVVRTNYCVICNNIHFSDDLSSKIEGIQMKDYFSSLQEKKVPGGEENLLFELYGIDSFDSLATGYKDATGLDVNDLFLPTDFSSGYMLVTGQLSGGIDAFGGGFVGAALVAGISIISGPPGWVAGISIIGAGVAGGLINSQIGGLGGFVVEGNSGEEYMSPSIYPFTSDALEKLDCENFASLI